MGGYEDNDAISDQILSSLVQSDSVNVAEQAVTEQEPIPPVHVDWLNSADQQQRADNHIGEEVNRRLRMNHEQAAQDRGIMHNNWSNLLDPTTTVITPPDT